MIFPFKHYFVKKGLKKIWTKYGATIREFSFPNRPSDWPPADLILTTIWLESKGNPYEIKIPDLCYAETDEKERGIAELTCTEYGLMGVTVQMMTDITFDIDLDREIGDCFLTPSDELASDSPRGIYCNIAIGAGYMHILERYLQEELKKRGHWEAVLLAYKLSYWNPYMILESCGGDARKLRKHIPKKLAKYMTQAFGPDWDYNAPGPKSILSIAREVVNE